MNQHHPSMKIKCVASIYTAYYKTVDIVVGRKMRRRKSKRRRDGTSNVSSQKGNKNYLMSVCTQYMY